MRWTKKQGVIVGSNHSSIYQSHTAKPFFHRKTSNASALSIKGQPGMICLWSNLHWHLLGTDPIHPPYKALLHWFLLSSRSSLEGRITVTRPNKRAPHEWTRRKVKATFGTTDNHAQFSANLKLWKGWTWRLDSLMIRYIAVMPIIWFMALLPLIISCFS